MKFIVSQYKLVAATIPVLGIFLFAGTSVFAQKYTREITRTYELIGDYVQINETRSLRIDQSDIYISAGNEDLTTLFADIRPNAETLSNVPDTLSTVSVTGSDGAAYANYIIEETATNPNLRVTLNRNVDFSNPFSVNIAYRSKGLVYKSGKVVDVFIPGFSSDFVFSDADKNEIVNTIVKIPKSSGSLSFAIPNGEVTQDSVYYYVRFKQEDLVGRSAWIEVGREQVYEFEISQKYLKSSDFIFGTNSFKMIIPRDIVSGNITQEVFFKSLSPSPSAVYKDADGNMIAEFTVSATSDGEIKISGFAKLTKTSIDYTKYPGLLSSIPENIIESNTQPGNFWESANTEITETALSVLGDLDVTKSSVYSIVERFYEYVIDKIDYSNVKRFGINERQGALKTLQGGAAVCMEYSDLYIALLRSIGIPARAAFGYGYTGVDTADSSEHQWVEVFIPDLGWVSVDTTWGESAPELIGGDLNHFFIHVASSNPNTPAPVEVSYIGNLGELEERQLKVIPSEQEQIGTSQLELLGTYPESSAGARAREMTIQHGLENIKAFYENNKDILNPIILVVLFLLVFPIVVRLVKFIFRKGQSSKIQDEKLVIVPAVLPEPKSPTETNLPPITAPPIEQ